MRLAVGKSDLSNALRTLSANRKKRFSSVVPIWIRQDPDKGELTLGEDSNHLSAAIPASGSWPAAGVTINLIALRRTIENVAGPIAELHVLEDAIVIPTAHGHARLKLLSFGPDNDWEPPAGKSGAFKLCVPCHFANCEDDTLDLSFRILANVPERRCCRAKVWALPAGQSPLCLDVTREPEVYRFVWRPALEASERTAVRIAANDAKVTLTSSRGFFERPQTRELIRDDWRRVQSAIGAADFWALPSYPWPIKVLDGASWAIEGRRGKWYNCVEGQSPTDKAFRTLGALFVALAKLDIDLY